MNFLINGLGFFTQFFPCILMIFLPFPQEAYRFRRRNILIWMSVITTAFSAGFAILMCLRDVERYPSHSLISNSAMLAAIFLALAAYVWLVRETLIKKVLVFLLAVFYAVTEYVIVNMLWILLNNGGYDSHYTYNADMLLLYAGVTVILLPLMLVCVIRPLKDCVQEIEPQNIRREFSVLILFTLLYICMVIYCNTTYGIDSSAGMARMFQKQCMLVLLMALNQLLIYWTIIEESVRRKREHERKRVMELQQLQYEKIMGDMETTRRMRHDMRHHYNILNDMLSRGKTKEMKDYLSGLIDSTVRHDAEIYCKNMMVNSLLQYYIGMARDEGILCQVHAECGDLAIKPEDLTVLLGNAMENAILSCRSCENRWISVQLGIVQSSLAIEISNSCREIRIDRRFQTQNGFSPAEAFISGRADEAYGLRSITRTAQKYGGDAKFRFNAESETFTARARLNIQTEL